MGQLILPSSVPGQGQLQNIEDVIGATGVDIGASTEAFLRDVTQGNRTATIVSNYKEWDPQKKVNFISTTNDLDLLYKLFMREGSGQISLYIQNQIARLGGQVPQRVAAPAGPQMQPAQPQPPHNVVAQILLEYPDWDDQRKVAFINSLKDIDLLRRLQKREPSAGINTQITARIAALETQSPVDGGQAVEGAIVDRELPQTPPPPPAPNPANVQLSASPAPAAPIAVATMPVAQEPPAPVAIGQVPVVQVPATQVPQMAAPQSAPVAVTQPVPAAPQAAPAGPAPMPVQAGDTIYSPPGGGA
jgi:hypothetical protein